MARAYLGAGDLFGKVRSVSAPKKTGQSERLLPVLLGGSVSPVAPQPETRLRVGIYGNVISGYR